jgi:rhodanese-related sulfurtransferase
MLRRFAGRTACASAAAASPSSSSTAAVFVNNNYALGGAAALSRRCSTTAAAPAVASTPQEAAASAPRGAEDDDGDDVLLIPRPKKPYNEAAFQLLQTQLREKREREEFIAYRTDALREAGGDASKLPRDMQVVEPTLEDLDISIPYVDCPFVAELVQRRLEERDKMHLKHQDKDKGDAAATGAAAAASTGSSTSHATFRAPVEDDTEQAGKELATTRQTKGNEVDEDPLAKAAKLEEPEPWRDEYEDGFVFIDVRTVGEITSWGIIEGAKVLPADEFWAAMTDPDLDAFFDKYGFHKPDKTNDTLLIYCQYGPRSLMAGQLAVYLGYKNVVILREGYYEWAKQFNKLCRRYRLLDIETRVVERRQEEFRLARGIGRDIAPEFNEYVDEEVDELRIETSRSRGEKVQPLPPLAEKVLLEVRGAQEQEAAQLTDPAYRAEFVRTYDAHYEPTLMEPPLRHVKGTENLRTPGENESMRKLAEEKNKSFANRAADAIGLPAAKKPRERHEESIGARLILANRRRREQRLDEEQEKVRAEHKDLQQKKRYPHRAVWRTF